MQLLGWPVLFIAQISYLSRKCSNFVVLLLDKLLRRGVKLC
mgnify:FL=1